MSLFITPTLRVRDTCPRLLLNLTKVGSTGNDFVLRLLGMGGMDYDSEDAYRFGEAESDPLLYVRTLVWFSHVETWLGWDLAMRAASSSSDNSVGK